MDAGHLPLWRNAIANPQPWVLGACIVVFALLIAREIWPAISALGASATTQRTAAVADRDQQLAARITEAQLFGRAPNQNDNLPQTDLQVTLRAVFASADPKQASAVIETSDGQSQIVRVGGTIAGNSMLQEVHDTRVVLSRNGTLETLYFPAPQESTEFAVAQATPAPAGDSANMPALPADASPDEIKRAAILQRLEELRARSAPR